MDTINIHSYYMITVCFLTVILIICVIILTYKLQKRSIFCFIFCNYILGNRQLLCKGCDPRSRSRYNRYISNEETPML